MASWSAYQNLPRTKICYTHCWYHREQRRCSHMQPTSPTQAIPALILPKEGCSLTPNINFCLPLGCEKPFQRIPNLCIMPVIKLVLCWMSSSKEVQWIWGQVFHLPGRKGVVRGRNLNSDREAALRSFPLFPTSTQEQGKQPSEIPLSPSPLLWVQAAAAAGTAENILVCEGRRSWPASSISFCRGGRALPSNRCWAVTAQEPHSLISQGRPLLLLHWPN